MNSQPFKAHALQILNTFHHYNPTHNLNEDEKKKKYYFLRI